MAINVTFGDYNPTEEEDILAIKVDIDLYFDGTGNNMVNIKERAMNTPAFQKNGMSDDEDTSYYDDRSNVARLWETSSQETKIYIDGIGTEERQQDSKKLGGAFGTGPTGVKGKVRIGCEKVAATVKKQVDKTGAVKVTMLTLDVFGFSRGAAAARNFVHEVGRAAHKSKLQTIVVGRSAITQRQDSEGNVTSLEELPAWGLLGQELKKKGIKVDALRVRFLGLFDTVSSYSRYFSVSPNFGNDIKELHLNHIGHARTIIHFTAQDEHRENFSLTHVPMGIEKSFPGVHSDIGGSYKDGPEVIKQLETSWTTRTKLDVFARKLIEDGWYKEHELSITATNLFLALKGTRERVTNTYSYIPLQFMADIGISKGIPFRTAVLENKYSINKDALLLRVKKRLKTYIFDGGPAYVFVPNSELPEQKDLRDLRNKYLHWSSTREGLGMDPNSDRKRVTYN
ncbi:MAG TPA: DUF2235 domain-containing protein [Flavobacterium sp.]|jgi:hypothetical protein